MAQLDFIPDPGIKSQAHFGKVVYYVHHPSRNNIRGTYLATKHNLQGGWFYDVDGAPYNNIAQAEQACQRDFDVYGESLQPGKEPPLPPQPPIDPEELHK